jgi:SAM-dependent methyltransferase
VLQSPLEPKLRLTGAGTALEICVELIGKRKHSVIALWRNSCPIRGSSSGKQRSARSGATSAKGIRDVNAGEANTRDSARPWKTLSSGFEQARAREDSLDRLVEWPAEHALLGDVTGLAVLDAGCGNGTKIAQLASEGAGASVGVDISGNFITPPPGIELITGDLSDLSAVPGIGTRRFDRILFLQSFGYAADPVRALRTARKMLTDDGFILLTRTQPVSYAIERAEQNGTSLGEEYFATEAFAYQHNNWNENVTLTKRPYTMSDLLNTFSQAGLWIEVAVEPQMPAETAAQYPHKQEILNKYLGVLMFKLRPIAGH